jgi:hypothetical protein
MSGERDIGVRNANQFHPRSKGFLSCLYQGMPGVISKFDQLQQKLQHISMTYFDTTLQLSVPELEI